MSRPDPAPTPPQQAARYWRANLRLTAALLLVWGVVSFAVMYFARELQFSFFDWPFAFWVAAQGALIVYVLIVGIYAWALRRLDRRYGAGEEPE